MSRHKLSQEEHDKRLELYNQGLSDHQIAEILYYNVSTIRNWRLNNNFPSIYNAKDKRLSAKEEQERLRLYHKGYTDAEIAIRVGMQRIGISAWRRSRNLKPNKKIKS